MISMKYYHVKVRHDRGFVTLGVTARNMTSARRQVTIAEKCPNSAIVSVKQQTGHIRKK
jgi:hypothetical protein